MKVAAIIQAREGSSRLPGKASVDICGKTALERVVERVKLSKRLDEVIVACTTNPKDDVIPGICAKVGCKCFRGSEEDVLTRVLSAAKEYAVDIIVEVTADCPLIYWEHIDDILSPTIEDNSIHGNIVGPERTFPRGYDIRVFTTKTLERVDKEVDNPVDRTHVSTWMYLNPKGKENYFWVNSMAVTNENRPDLDITLDTPEDLELIRWLFTAGKEYRLELTCQEVIHLIDTYPEKYSKVAKVQRKDYFAELAECYASQKGAKRK